MYQVFRNSLIYLFFGTFAHADYWQDRAKLIDREKKVSIGGTLHLTDVEVQANHVLMHYKEKEWQSGFQHPTTYPPLTDIGSEGLIIPSTSKIFDILRALPKGSLLHVHFVAMSSFEYLFNLTYRDHLYVCTDNKKVRVKFFAVPDDTCKWVSMADKRRADPFFDSFLAELLTVLKHTPYGNIYQIWEQTEIAFGIIGSIVNYKPIYEDYLYQSLVEMYEDNIKYVEIRSNLQDIYDLDGNIYDQSDALDIIRTVVERFQAKRADFRGVKIIYAVSRNVDNSTIQAHINKYKQLKECHDDLLAGFDLVGNEEQGRPLKDFVDFLLPIKDEVDFYFHAGATAWYGSDPDENIFDALLLGTKRIGNGYGLAKHPRLMQKAKDSCVAIEVCPLSNEVLKLVSDMRNHPGAIFGAFGLPMVIVNDFPTIWKSKAVTPDWYLAFMVMASRRDGLQYLKQLAYNSIEHTAMNDDEKQLMLEQWHADWNQFVMNLAEDKI